MKKSIYLLSTLLFTCLTAQVTHADVNRLAWMVGNWGGKLGDNYLEEIWHTPRAGNMAAAVRLSSTATERNPASVVFLELITISDTEDGGLMLHIQQFSPALEARFAPQSLKMTAIGEQAVTFSATKAGGLARVSYRLMDDGVFSIQVESADGGVLSARLTAQEG